MIKIGNGSGFWGDDEDAPIRLVNEVPDLDYLTLDYLSELTMSILAVQRDKNPQFGYAKDFVKLIRRLVPHWHKGAKVKVIANAGGLNPLACARACKKVLNQAESSKKIGVVLGDDVLHIVQSHPNQEQYRHLETGETLAPDHLVTANAYLGATSIVDALNKGADIVITGRIADPTLTVAPCIAHFGWDFSQWDQLAGATIAGHLIECGTQATGGISTEWLSLKNNSRIGFPIVEMEIDGSFTLTKPLGSGGSVNERTVKEQLLYEIGDPSSFLTPDVIVNFLSLHLQTDGIDRIRITGVKGAPPPKTFKVSGTYREGWRAEGYLTLFGKNAHEKSRMCAKVILDHMKAADCLPEAYHSECIGAGDVVPGVLPTTAYPESMECILRIAVSDGRREIMEKFIKEIAPLVTSGPQGVTGYASGRPSIRPVFGFWPCLIDRDLVKPSVEIL